MLQALKVRGEWLANMDVGRPVGSTWPGVLWRLLRPEPEDPLHEQQGDRGDLPFGPPGGQAVTYAVWGPWGKREED
jgi:hypothetical protein